MNDLRSYVDFTAKQVDQAGVDDFSLVGTIEMDAMVRFSNNSLSVVKGIETITLFLYVGLEKKRAVGSLSNISESSILKFTESLVRNCRISPRAADYATIPEGGSSYQLPTYDKDVAENPEVLAVFARDAIDSCLSSGATRVAGSMASSVDETQIRTSGGADSLERSTSLELNIRGFTESGSSGQGLSCASSIKQLDAASAGHKAGVDANRSKDPRECKEAKYDVVFMPTVAADLFHLVGQAASAFNVDAGTSFLAGLVDKRIGVDSLSMRDVGIPSDGVSGRGFDDEGFPTTDNTLIDEGFLRGYLHNSTTAKKFHSKPTGNAGIINPHPWNLEISPGTYSLDEMISGMKKGIIFTNNWYTRFHNLRGGTYSTSPRDAAFMIEEGEIVYPITGTRISDALPRQLESIMAISKAREWIKWWEVSIPTLSPTILVKDVFITNAIG